MRNVSLASEPVSGIDRPQAGPAPPRLATSLTLAAMRYELLGDLPAADCAFMAGLHASLVIAAGVLLAAAVAILWGAPANSPPISGPDLRDRTRN